MNFRFMIYDLRFGGAALAAVFAMSAFAACGGEEKKPPEQKQEEKLPEGKPPVVTELKDALVDKDYAVVMAKRADGKGDWIKLAVFEGDCQKSEKDGKPAYRVKDLFKYADPITGEVVKVDSDVFVKPDFTIISGTIERSVKEEKVVIRIRQEDKTFIRETTQKGRTREAKTEAAAGVTYLHLGLQYLWLLDPRKPAEYKVNAYLAVDNVTRDVKIKIHQADNIGRTISGPPGKEVPNEKIWVTPVDIFLTSENQEDRLYQKFILGDMRLTAPEVTDGGISRRIHESSQGEVGKDFPPPPEKVKALLDAPEPKKGTNPDSK
jgi:hypothetical protein